MISKALFMEAWKGLERRFGEQSSGSAANYLTYLSPMMEDEEFTEAARAVWASREFFPRPADFLMVRQGTDWRKAQEAVDLASKKEDWSHLFRSMSPSGQMTIKSIGGIFCLYEGLQRNPSQARKDFGREYEMAITTMAIQTALPAGEKTKQIEGGKGK